MFGKNGIVKRMLLLGLFGNRGIGRSVFCLANGIG